VRPVIAITASIGNSMVERPGQRIRLDVCRIRRAEYLLQKNLSPKVTGGPAGCRTEPLTDWMQYDGVGRRFGSQPMSTDLETAVECYVRARSLKRGTRDEYFATLRKWKRSGDGAPIEQLTRKHIRDFLDWVHERAVLDEGLNPGRTANKSRENLRAVMSWAWEQDLIDLLPRFPKPRLQRDVAGRHYLSKPELNALYFATYSMSRPRG
jgi:hypothetical protein